jgi:hypothetical protein
MKNLRINMKLFNKKDVLLTIHIAFLTTLFSGSLKGQILPYRDANSKVKEGVDKSGEFEIIVGASAQEIRLNEPL